MLASSSLTEPPTASTLPSGSITAFISMRSCDIMLGPDCHAGVVAPRSMISVVALRIAGFPPPMIITWDRSCSPASTAAAPKCRRFGCRRRSLSPRSIQVWADGSNSIEVVPEPE